MVVFVCNGCGDTLKRADVEKHCRTCQRSDALSCADCNKDFYGNEYKDHLKCISELEKYSSKDHIPKLPKGEVKQDGWMQTVLSRLNKPDLPEHLKPYVKRLRTFTNIPRKMSSFSKFARNCLTIRKQELVDELWNVIDADKKNVVANVTGNEKDAKNVASEPSTVSSKNDKQRIWIKQVHRTIKKQSDHSPDNLKLFLEKLKTMDDIPRQRKHFPKYAELKFGLKISKTVEQLWSFIAQTDSQNCADKQSLDDDEEIDDEATTEDGGKGGKKALSKRDRKQLRQEIQGKKQKKDKQKVDAVENNSPGERRESDQKSRKRKAVDDEIKKGKKKKVPTATLR